MKYTVKRMISALLVVAMMISVLPLNAFAAENTDDLVIINSVGDDTDPVTESSEPASEPTAQPSEPASEPTTEPEPTSEPTTEPTVAPDPTEEPTEATEPEETVPEETEETLPEETEETEPDEEVRMIKVRIAAPDGAMFLTVAEDSLQAKIAAAGDGETVTMDRNYTENVYFPMDRTVILDMNGYTLEPDTSETGTSIANTITVFGTAAIKNGTIDGWLEGKDRNVRGALVTNGGKLILGEKAEIRSFTVKGSGAGVHVDGDGQLELAGGKIRKNTATESGGGIFIYDGGKLSAANAEISGNKAANGGGIAMYRMYQAGNITSMTLADNVATENGGGWLIGGVVDLTQKESIANVTFRNNSAVNGGGLYCTDKVTANFTNLNFDGNTASTSGGAAYFKAATVSTFRSCQVRNTYTTNMGALYFGVASTANFESCNLSDNQSGSHGGALYAYAALTSELRDVTIQNNTAGLEGTGDTYGGAFCLAAYSKITLYSGIISGNTAKVRQSVSSYARGGGFWFNNNSTFTMYGGTFEDNYASQYGGGVYMYVGGKAVIEGGVFRENRCSNCAGLFADSHSTLEIKDVLAEKNNGAAFLVWAGNSVVNVSGGTFRENAGGWNSYSAVGQYQGTMTITGGTFTGNKGNTVGVASGTTNISGGTFTENSTSVYAESGTINVNGGEIYENTGTGVSSRNAKINIQDGAYIHDNKGWGVYNSYNYYNSTIEMTGGVIENNGGGINNCSNTIHSSRGTMGTVQVSGGVIRNNGGRGINSAVVEVTGGEITGNVGGIVATQATISGGTITGNSATTTGGGISITAGTKWRPDANTDYTYVDSRLEITGGTIKDNRAVTKGNDIYIAAAYENRHAETIISIPAAKDMTGGAEGDVWQDEIDGENLTEAVTRRHNEEKEKDAYTFRSATDEVARIGEQTYPSLQAAFDALKDGTAPEGETTVYLLKDDNEKVTVPAGITATLDLQGHLVFTNSGTILTLGEVPVEPEEGEEPVTPDPVNLTIMDSMGGGKLTGATTGAVVVNQGSSFTMRDISIANNFNTGSGGGVILRTGSTMTMESGTITGNRGTNGSGIYGEAGSTLTIESGAITVNRSIGGSGGTIYSSGRVIMNGGEITKNEISVYNPYMGLYIVGKDAYFELNGGTISDNLRGYMDGTTMNWRNSNGLIGIMGGAKMVMNGGSIENNKSITTTMWGANAVYVSSASFTMNEGTISGNTGGSGTVSLVTGASFTMNGGSITGNRNTSNDGGAIRENGSNVVVNLLGGEITGNSSVAGGGGAFFASNSTVKVTIDGTKIYGNTSDNGQGNDVFFGGETQVLAFQNPAEYGMDYNCWHDDVGGGDYGQTDLDALCAALGWTKKSDTYRSTNKGFTAATAVLPPAGSEGAVAYYVPTLFDDNGAPKEVTANDYVYFDSLGEAMEALQASTVPSGAVIYLMQDFGETVQVPAVTFTLDLNGHTLTTDKGNATIFTLASGADMTLWDTRGNDFQGSGEGTLTMHPGFATGRGINVNAGSSLTVQGGRITGFATVNQSCPAISCGGNLTITGGSVTDNVYAGTGNSGAIYVNNANAIVTIKGGTFSGNSGRSGGALAIETANKLTIENASFEGNSAIYAGGAVSIRNCFDVSLDKVTFRNNETQTNAGGGLAAWDGYKISLRVTDCSFGGNTSGTSGGGLYVGTYAAASITGGSFVNNRSTTSGGGLCSSATAANGGNLTMTGVTFQGNRADTQGGGAYVKRLTMKNCTFQENTAATQHGGGLMHYGGTNASDALTATNCTFTGNTAGTEQTTNPQNYHGGGLYSDYASMTVTDCTFEDNTVTGAGGGIYRYRNSGNCTTTVENCTFHDNSATAGGGARIECAATLRDSEFYKNNASGSGAISVSIGEVNIIRCKVHDNKATGSGGGVGQSWNNPGTVILSEGTEVYNNEARAYGGGFYCRSGRMEGDARVYDNTARYFGGGIFVDNGSFSLNDNAEIYGNKTVMHSGGGIAGFNGSCTVNGGSIHDNTAKESGGGIYTGYAWNNSNGGSVTMNGGEIYNNTANANGGGVYTYTFTMNEGVIRNNTALGNGGGVGGSGSRRTFKMFGGEIRDNEAGNSGGGVFEECQWNYASHFWLVGGVISGNRAARSGGGVYLQQGTGSQDGVKGDTRVYGDMLITDNHAGNYGGGIYYYGYSSSQQEHNFGLYTEDPDHPNSAATMYGNTAALGQDYYITANANNDICQATDMDLPANLHVRGWLDESNNQLITTQIHGRNPRYWALTLDYTDDEIVAAVGDQLFSSVSDAVAYVQANPGGSHEIIMVADSRENVTVPSGVDVTLNLNGHTLQGFSTAVTLNGTMILVDVENHSYDNYQVANKIGAGTAGAGTISGNAATSGGGFLVQNGGQLTIQSGNLSNCHAASSGAAIYVNGGKVTMNGGRISENFGYYGAIGINGSMSTFVMNDGEVCYNENRGTGSYVENGTLRNIGGTMMIQGGQIHDNVGRSVVHSNGSTTISGGSFTNNQIGASGQAGNGVVYVNGGTTNIGGTDTNPVIIRDNKVTGNGGAIYQTSGNLYLSNVEIQNNTATGNGGAIYQGGGTMVITGGTEISGNTAGTRGGAIYQSGNTNSGGTIQILGGTIVDNRAPVGGGIVQVAQSRAACSVFDGVRLYENVSTISNTGNDIYSAYEGTGDWEMVTPKCSMVLESVVNMKHPKYNVWRDDVYTDGNYTDAEHLGEGMYITGPIDQSSNLQLTTYYYETDKPLVPLANNRQITSLSFKTTDDGAPYISGSYASPAADVTTEEKTAKEMGWQESGETYADSSGNELPYLIGPGGKLYEQDQMAQWTPGEDGSKSSSLVLTKDTVTYSLTAEYKATEGSDESTVKARVWLEVEVDADASEVNLAGQIPSGFRGYVLTEERDGETVQIMRCYREEDLKQEGLLTYSVSIPVLAMKNGDTLKPSFKVWVEGNEENEENPPTVSSDRLTVSATGKYNVTLKQNSQLAYTGYFDTKTGQEASRPEDGEDMPDGVVYGTVLGYGITVMMDNTEADGKTVPASKGLKGLEIPADGLELDLHMKGGLYLDGEAVDLDGNGGNTVTPVFWALNENVVSNTGRGEGQSASTFNMNWDDEDEQYVYSNYAYNAAPFNTGNNAYSCYSGGGWSLTGVDRGNEETVLHLKVNGYAFNMSDDNPTQNSDKKYSSEFGGSYAKAFTAGYLQVIFPFPEEVTKTANGYLSVDMQAAVSDVKIQSASGQEPLAGTDLEVLEAYFGEDAEKHATGEVRFSDNRVASSNGLYVYHGSGEGCNIGVTNYWLTESRGAIAGEMGTGTTPLGSKVYMGGRVYYTSEAVRTDEETYHGGPNPYYIPEDQFNPQTDNKTEFFYATAMNVLQKFDADAYEPLSSTAVVNQRITGAYNTNNICVASTESSTNWGSGLSNLTTSMNLTVLYAAKPDGTNWVKDTTTAQMMLDDNQATWADEEHTMILYKGQTYRPDQAVFSDGGVGEMDTYHEGQLIYFETLEDLYAYFAAKGIDGKCVAILYEARDCCIRTGRSICFEHKMQVTEDFAYTGQTYCTTNEARAWVTYRPGYKGVRGNTDTRKAFLYDFNWDDVSYEGVAKGFGDKVTPGKYEKDVEYTTGKYEPKTVSITRRTIQRRETEDDQGNPIIEEKWVTVTQDKDLWQDVTHVSSDYIKTEYEYGYQKGGTHNGWVKGNTLLVHTLTSGITINGNDKVSASGNNTKTSYNLSLGERVANFVVAPRLEKASGINNALVTDGSQATQVSIDLTLPAGLRYREGSITFDYTPVKVNGKDEPTYKEGELEWVIGPAQTDENGVTTIHLTTYVSDISKNLPKIRFSGFIGVEGEGDVKPGDTLTTEASIYATYEEHNQLAALASHDSFTIMVIKEGNVGIYQDALTVTSEDNKSHSLLTEVGEDFGYKLVYYNDDANAVGRVTLADVLPYNGDGRTKEDGEGFDGGYRVKQIQVVFTGSGAAETAQKFEDSGKLCIQSNVGLPNRNNEYKDGWKTLLADFEKNPSGAYTPDYVRDNDVDHTTYTFTYDIPEELLHQLSTEELGKMLYVDLPDVAGHTYVTVNVLLSPTDETEEGNTLITDGNNATQQGGNKYYNDFVARTEGGEMLSSLDVDVTVVQRGITGYAFMDMNQDGRYTLGNDADKTLAGITVTLYTIDGERAVDVVGNEIAPAITDGNGRYTFNNVAPGEYTVRFTDPKNQYVWKVNKPKFSELAVTQLPGADSGYYETAADVNRCVANYTSTFSARAATDPGLQAADLSVSITMPPKGEMKTPNAFSTNNNAGFYCIEAKLVKDWTGMVQEVPAGTVLTYHLTGTPGSYQKDIAITQNTPWSSITAEDVTEDLAEADKLTLTATATMPTGKSTPPTYHWETNVFYLPAEDSSGNKITYDFTEELGGAFEDIGYDTPVLKVRLDEKTGQTIFEAGNHQRSYDFALTKVDAKTGKTLDGAKFQFTHNGETLKFTKVADGAYRVSCDNVDVKNGETIGETQVEVGKNGTLTLTGLPEGEVTMTETKAPKGYILPKGDWKIVFGIDGDGNSETSIDESENKTGQPAIKVDKTETQGTDALGNPITTVTVEYTVPNIEHIVVPITGAEGVGMYLIAGLAIAVAGALLLLEYRRRKRQTGSL